MIINTSVSNAPHNLIDIHTNQSNIVIDGCELFYTDEYTGAKQVSIYLHNANTDNIIINDTYIHDAYRNIEIYNSDNVTITNSVIENSTASGIHLIGSTSSQELDNWGITNLTVASNTFKNISHPYTFSQDNNNMMNLDLLNNTYENNTLESDYENAVTPIYQATMVGTYPVILSSVDTLFDVGDIIDSELVAMPAVEYFYGNTDYSYLDYPEVLEWNSTLGIFTKRFLLDGTILEEDAPERVTGVEVMP
jgi:hypothetical protein